MTDQVRECGDCSMCCKVMRIPDTDSPAGSWCQHCKPGAGGCMIYDERPDGCKDFICSWLAGEMPDSMHPKKTKCVLAASTAGWILCYVDPGFPNAWREKLIGGFISRISKKHPVVVIAGSFRRIICGSLKAANKAREIMDAAEFEEHERPEISSIKGGRR